MHTDGKQGAVSVKQSDDQAFMAQALQKAQQAMETGDVPVGAVMVKDGEVIASACNRREADGLATAHAELLCVEAACRHLGRWRLSDCTLYVTLEPCPMCAGAAVNAHMERIVVGAEDETMGACGTAVNVTNLPKAFKPEIYRGLMAEECAALLKDFFAKKRK